MPFQFSYKRGEHFDKHVIRRKEFSCANEMEYEKRADAFLFTPLRETTLQCRRPQGDIIRYDLQTAEFGVVSRGFVFTYFIAKPLNHGYASNVCYWYAECWRIF